MTAPLRPCAPRTAPARALAATLLLALLAALLGMPPTVARAQDSPPPEGIRKNNLSGPDGAASAYASTASDGNLVVSAWQDYGHFGGAGPEIVVAVSDDAGQSWTAPLNVSVSPDLDSARASVAVHGQQIWVVWQEGTDKQSPGAGNHDIWAVQSPDGGRTWDIPLLVHEDRTDSMFPQVAIHGGRPYVAWAGLDHQLWLASSADQGLTWQRTDLGRAVSRVVTTSMAVADGQLYLTWTGAGLERTAAGGVHLLTVGPDHQQGDVVEVVPPGTTVYRPTVDAEGSTVAIGWSERAERSTPTVARVAVSRDAGATFSDAASLTPPPGESVFNDVLVHDGFVTAAYLMPGGQQRARRSDDGGRSWQPPVVLPSFDTEGGGARLSGSPTDSARPGPTAAWDYTVPDRFGPDADGDGLVDYRTDPAWLAAKTLPVDIDACASAGVSEPIEQYTVTIGSSTWTSGECEVRVEVPGEGRYLTKVEVRRGDGQTDVVEREIEVVDHLIFSLGDSVASGEGVPDHEIGPGRDDAVWVDERCHRSAQAGPAKAALALEVRDPRSSVTFVSLACSGASMLGPNAELGGLLTPYEGIVEAEPPLPPQVHRARELAAGRTVDSMFLSIGANDIRFSEVVKVCLYRDCLIGDGVASTVAERIAALPSRYAALATALKDLVKPERVFLTEYFDSLHDENGTLQMDCVSDGFLTGIHRDEARFALTGVMEPLNAAVDQAAAEHGWTHVGGLFDAFREHGYCSRDGWVVQIGQSVDRQGWIDGGFHPNRAGHDVYGAALAAAAGPALPVVVAPTPPAQDEPVDPVAGLRRSDVHVVYLDKRSVHIAPVLPSAAGQAPVEPVDLARVTSGYSGDVQVAATPTGPVVTWMEMTRADGDPGGFEVMSSGVLTVPPNLRVDRVTAVQASDDARTAAAGKRAAAKVEVVSTFPTTQHVAVQVETGDWTVRRMAAIEPGRSVLHLVDDAFVPEPGEDFALLVTLDPENVLEEADEADGSRRSPAMPVVEGRPLRLLFVSVKPSSGEVTDCKEVRKAELDSASFLRDALPLAPELVQTEHSCASTLIGRPGKGGKDDAKDLLHQAGRLALSQGFDHVVGVTPTGYLDAGTTSVPAVGLALVGSSADDGYVAPSLLVDPAHSPTGSTTTHEVGHAFGLHHVEGSKAPGLRLSTMEVQVGEDLMSAKTAAGQWISGAMWERLLRRLHATSGPAGALAEDSGSLVVSLGRDADGAVTAPPWQRSDLAPDVPLGAPGELSLAYLSADGEELGRTGLPVSAAEPVGAQTEDSGIGTLTEARVPWVDDAARLVVQQGDDVLLDRPVSAAAPTVTMTSYGTEQVQVGAVVPLVWAGADADGDALTYAVDVSRDAGATWVPLVTGISEPRYDVPVGPALAGAALTFRVTATDGVLAGTADAGPVSVGGTDREELIAFVLTRDRTWPRTFAGNLAVVSPEGGPITELTTSGVDKHPTWSPDGTRLVFERAGSLRTIADDGSDDRELLTKGPGEHWSCPAWSPDGAWIAYRSATDLWVMRADGTERRKVVADVVDHVSNVNGCPAWSPDSTRVALVTFRGGWIAGVHVVDMATGAITRVPDTDSGVSHARVAWSSTGVLMSELEEPAWGWYVFDEQGNRISQVSANPDHGNWRNGAFSPTGDRAVGTTLTDYPSGSRNDLEIRPLDAPTDGTKHRRITDLGVLYPDAPVGAWQPAWRPGAAPTEEPPAPPAPRLAQLADSYRGEEGAPITLDATGGLRPGGAVPSYSWDLDDDGAYDDARGATVSFLPSDDGERTVRLRAELADGTSDETSAPVTIDNAAPRVALSPAVAAVGSPVTLEVSVVDAADDVLDANVTWGDGAVSERVTLEPGRQLGTWTIAASHTYAAADRLTARVEVCDDEGSCADAETAVDVAERAPEAAALMPDAGPAEGGTPVLLTGRFLGDAAVSFGGTPAKVLRGNDRELFVQAPALEPGSPVEVVVTTPAGASSPLRWTPENAPAAVSVESTVATRVGAPVELPVNAADPEARPVDLVVTSGPQHGTVTVTGSSVSYAPAAGWAGPDSFAVAGDDGVDVGASAVVTVTTGSRAPVPAGETVDVAAASSQVATVTLLGNDVDPEGGALSVVGVEPVGAGTAVLDGDAVVVGLGGASSLALRYTVEDPSGVRATTTSWVRRAGGQAPPPGGGPSPTAPPSPSPSPTSSPSPGPTPAPTTPAPTTPAPTPAPGARATDDSCPDGQVPEDGFADVPDLDVHESAVDCLVWWQVTRGVSATAYAPHVDVTRAQMATFLANVVTASGGTLPEPSRDWFDDDDGSVHEHRINQLREAGIVAGRDDGTFGPAEPVRRGAMATFLVRVYEYRSGQALTSTRDWFADDDGTTHEGSIDKAAEAGFTGGVQTGAFVPQAAVRRGQMASFLTRTLDLLVEQGLADTP